MRLLRLLAVPVGVIVVVGMGTTAEAEGREILVRYAGLGDCDCAPWKLWMRDGRVIKLPEARVFSVGGRRAPLALSPDGRYVAYFQLKDGALVIREMSTGTVRSVPGVTWSRELRTARLDLAPAGRYVVLGNGRDSQVIDAQSGMSSAVPLGLRPWSFSPDAKFVLAVDDSFRAGIYSTSPWGETGRVPVGGALSPDGRTVAHFTARDSAISLWDVATGKAITLRPIALPARKIPIRLRWDGEGRLDLQMVTPRRARGRIGVPYAWYRVDPTTGRAWRIGAFTVPSSVRHPIVTGLAP
ncbi:WD40 repeat domain-containing protein [Streptosporangium lutulentum]|uniref:WD40 repeat protein n=1 Tax=Streptosporangium lutulentum TaxID=1461250 RepID=A0ABT9QK82_9ACTN|nr:WD40 repeat domain-containing protein [Streptosporangium lutulentum]MDP9847166.1 WD40 repeat protein [Streptosporangium lutulentum]